MLPKVDPTKTQAWKALTQHYAKMKTAQMKKMFADDPKRFEHFSLRFDEMLFDFSNQ